MGFRDDLRLDDFIASSDELSETLGYTNPAGSFGFSFGGATAVSFMPIDPTPKRAGDYLIFDSPAQYGSGIPSRSTCTELVSWPSVCWDVNGYYHALGVGFRANRRQLMQGYRDRGGPDDDRLTYYFQQLLDPAVRRLYDSAPLGSVFFDRYVEEEIRRKAHAMAAQMNQRGADVTPEDILERMGFVRVDEEVPQEEGELDSASEVSDDEGASPPPAPEAEEGPWPYTYFLWRVKANDPRDRDIEYMRRWQDLIAQGCIEQGLKTTFAVGLMGELKQGSRIATMSVEGVTVVFIAQTAVDDMDDLVRSALNRLNTRD